MSRHRRRRNYRKRKSFARFIKAQKARRDKVVHQIESLRFQARTNKSPFVAMLLNAQAMELEWLNRRIDNACYY